MENLQGARAKDAYERSIPKDLERIEKMLEAYYHRMEIIADRLSRPQPSVASSSEKDEAYRPIEDRIQAIGQMLEGRFETLIVKIERPLGLGPVDNTGYLQAK